MSTLVAPRSRAAARVNRISVDLDRSSGYLLGKVYWNDDSRVQTVLGSCGFLGLTKIRMNQICSAEVISTKNA